LSLRCGLGRARLVHRSQVLIGLWRHKRRRPRIPPATALTSQVFKAA
jgi:hypothetical protein